MFLSDKNVIDGESARMHLVSFGSTSLKRGINSTIKAETYQLAEVVEAADLSPKTWESSAASFTTSVRFTDCRSCYDTLQKPVAKTVDKRLGI